MRNTFFRFKEFTIRQERAAMKVTTDSCLFGAWAAQRLQDEPADTRLLDIGAGTGLLSLMVAQQCAGQTDAVEIDAGACAQALENIAASPWKERIKVYHNDLRKWAPPRSYDIIFSNPPFYEQELTGADEGRNIAHHSYHFSLVSLLDFIHSHLEPGGRFYLLLPFKRKEELLKQVQQHSFFVHEMCEVKQSVVHQPFRILVAGGRDQAPAIDTEMSICEADKKTYTAAFQQLLKPYYLYL